MKSGSVVVEERKTDKYFYLARKERKQKRKKKMDTKKDWKI